MVEAEREGEKGRYSTTCSPGRQRRGQASQRGRDQDNTVVGGGGWSEVKIVELKKVDILLFECYELDCMEGSGGANKGAQESHW